MNDMAFGLTMTVAGMGVLYSPYLLTLVVRLLNKLFPFKDEEAGKGRAGTPAKG
jgi:hypothetical protein